MELKFQARLKIAKGIAHGVRYMHEECPQGPVVHGDLKACNIFLGRDLQPMVKYLKTKSITRISPSYFSHAFFFQILLDFWLRKGYMASFRTSIIKLQE